VTVDLYIALSLLISKALGYGTCYMSGTQSSILRQEVKIIISLFSGWVIIVSGDGECGR